MNKFEKLKFYTDALYHAIGEDKKFFAPVHGFIDKLHELTTTKANEVTKEDLRFLAQKVEDFFAKFRPSQGSDYVPPSQAELNDDTVKGLYEASMALDKMSQKEFESVKPALEEKKSKQSLKDKLNEVISIVESTCEAKGWAYRIDSVDKNNWKYASITVQRLVSGAGQIDGKLDLSINGGVRLSLSKTSFHDYGLPDLRESIMRELEELPWLQKRKKAETPLQNGSAFHLERLVTRFAVVARQLKQRHDERDTLIIEDEYDVQDLLHALLRIYFEDVRPEEYTPSYAGSSSRMDFLLKKDEIVVEAKMASKILRDKLVGEQLIIDIKKYQAHQNCKTLYCLVYDPNSFIKNPVALENDLTGKHDNLTVRVFVVPH
jgi:hypothetical protein